MTDIVTQQKIQEVDEIEVLKTRILNIENLCSYLLMVVSGHDGDIALGKRHLQSFVDAQEKLDSDIRKQKTCFFKSLNDE